MIAHGNALGSSSKRFQALKGRQNFDSEWSRTSQIGSLSLAMLMTLTSTHEAATDLVFLLRKNPARPQSFSLSFGKAHVFYPEATPERCTVALLVEVDPVGLVRNRRGPAGEGGALEQYVNDRPYAASSFLSVAIAEVFGSALAGKSKERPELADTPLPLRATFSALPCRGRLSSLSPIGREKSPNLHSRFEPLNCSSGRESALTSSENQMERTHVRCYRVQGESRGECESAPLEILRRLFEPLGYTVSARRLLLDEKFPDWGESSCFHVELSARLPLR
jgi:hypothetical protein